MKLTAAMLLIFSLHLSAGSYAQKITLHLKNVPIVKVFKEIHKQTGFNFFYNTEMLKQVGKVSIGVDNAELAEVMDQCLLKQPLHYTIVNNSIILAENTAPPAEIFTTNKNNGSMAAVLMDVTGVVTDAATGKPLQGATVNIKGGTTGVSTDANGSFKLAVPEKGAVLIISFIGYDTYETAVTNSGSLKIALVLKVTLGDEVVVTSFGIKKQAKSLGYATSTITAKELTEAGNTNIASALYGKAAGVTIKTAPGGASSAVNVQIRGINSIYYNQQPLYVVDGVIIRNEGQYGAAGRNNGGFYDDQRIRGNGVLDVNPEDIESLSILKGASATALYGSDANSGVIVITTKKGTKGKKPVVDFNYFGTAETPAYLPKYQNVYGQGYDRATNLAVGASEDGSFPDAQSPAGWRPNFRAYADFGPKMEGQQVRWWDGSIRSYSPQPDNYKDIFRTGYSSLANVALSNQTENASYRVTASRLDYGGIQRKSGIQKNTFGINSSVKLSSKVSVDVVANFVNTKTHNRPYQTNRLAQSFDGFFGREEDMNLILQKYQTSQGYSWVPFNQTARNPAEAFTFNVRPNLYDYFFTTLRHTYDEIENRLYSSATLNWEVINHLKFRGRIGNDYTGRTEEGKNYSSYPSAFNPATSSTGAYSIASGIYSVLYGDLLLTYSNNITKDLGFSVSGGFTSRSEHYKDQSSSTSNGLVTENFFSIGNSYGIPNTSASSKELLKYGTFGIVNLSFRDYLFAEATMRQESSSTLPPQNNTYYYPSVNGSFVFSEAARTILPQAISYGKLRLSYGVVGNPAPIYVSNIAYAQSSLQSVNGSVPQLSIPSTYGNSTLRPEKKHEYEGGLELRFLKDRLGMDVTYYSNRIKDIILPLQIAPSNGAASQIVNAGEIGNKGLEVALNAIPISNKTVKWQTRFNFAFNRSKVYSLASNIPELSFYNGEGGAIKATAKPGDEMGNIYVYPISTDTKGNSMVDDNGLYVIDQTRYIKAGNLLPKVTGGFSNTVSYKRFSLSALVDYRLGGQMISTPLKYGLNAGMYESTLKYRDAAHGGLTYYADNTGKYIPLPASSSAGPAGEKVYHDGVVLKGVNAAGAANAVILDAASYYLNEFSAGDPNTLNQEGAIYDNSYIKMREITIGYSFPIAVTKKLGMSSLRFSLIGRNLFYFWRTLKNLDPETTIGNQWFNQGIDNGSVPATRSYGVSLNASF